MSAGSLARLLTDSPTFVPQTAVAIPHPALADLREVEYANAQADIVQYAVRVFLV